MSAGFKAQKVFSFLLVVSSICLEQTHTVTLKDIFTSEPPLLRVSRDSKYSSRYDARTDSSDKALKPEETSEISNSAGLGKRCVRCENGYLDRYPGDRNWNNNDDRSRDYDRYDDRYYERDRYYDRDRYGDRYDRNDKYRYPNRYDRYGDRNSDRYDRYDKYDRYDRDRYYDYDRYDPYERTYDRYYRYERYPERGIGYDNRGYDYRQSDRDGYRPWDETYRGSSGFDDAGRGYYFASGRPEYSSSGYGGYGSGRYASGWNYGNSGTGRDDYYRDRDYYGSSRPYKDPYDYGYRTTSYLYGRPSSTTMKPSSSDDSSNTQSSSINS